ncbi:MAG TPA: alpha/beta hydrolase [Anaerolineales bacterium]|nr:alpha/beta hydrolase [Anaerolineales bacterium]
MLFSYRDETKELNELTRKELGGSFIRLPDGVTHYEISNPDKEDTVIFVHGFSVPYFIFDPTFAFLTQSGFRVVRYDLFGRGFSDRPETRYSLDFYVKQLGDLLDALHFTPPVSLAGLSTGGPITATFTARFPQRVAKLVLIDPIGTEPLPFARLLKLATLPLLGEALLSLAGNGNRFKNTASKFFDREHVEHFRARYIVAMQYKGFRRGILSSLRNGLIDPVPEIYERVSALVKPVLLFWGRNDPTVPFNHSDALRATIPHIEFHAIDSCGHIPHYEKPDMVNPILLDFLRR